MKQKSILVLAASRLQVPAIVAARRLGLRVIAADGNPKAPGLARADRSYVIDILDAQACLEVARREKVDGVIHICSEVSMYPMGRINEELGLHGISAGTAVRATNKEMMRRAFETGGAPSPRSIGAATEEEAWAAVEAINGPVIIKPSRNSGKRGITSFPIKPTRLEVSPAFQRALRNSRDPSVVVEEFVEGPEFSVELLTWNGVPHVIAVTDRTNTGSPHWVETGHSVPSQRSPVEVAALKDAAIRGVKALGIDWAAAHAEMKLTSRGPVLMEIGARLGGGHITTDIVPLATGIGMVEGAIRLALGEEPDLTPSHPPRGAAIRFLWPRPGKVLAIHGYRTARAMPGIHNVTVDVREGDSIREIIDCSRRIGHVIAEGETAREAVGRAEAARDAIRIVTTKSMVAPSQRTLMVLAAGRLQAPAVTVAKRMGLRVVALDGDPGAPGLALADKSYVVNIADVEACLLVARRERVSGVIHICSEVSIYAMARINELLGLHGLRSYATAIRVTNKEQMRRAFEEAGAPSPLSIGVTTEEEALAAAEEIGWPLIVKPSRNSGSRGVTAFRQDQGPEAFLAACRVAVAESRDASAVVEKYVEGPEFSIEILVWNGTPYVLAVTDKVTTGTPHFVEIGHSQPSMQPPQAREAIVDAAIRGVKALGIDWAAAHAEVKLAPDGPYLMEIGGRLGGDFITTELVPRSTGIDMVEGAIKLALGEEPDLKPRHAPRGAAIRYLTPRPGRVMEVRGVEQARWMPGVKIVEVDVEPGGTVPGLTSSLTRVGHVIAEGRDAPEAIACAEAARDAIQILTE